MKIMISVGEASGDMHTANALQQLQLLSPANIEAFGMGGKRLAACGMEITVDNKNHSVMGLVEVLHKYPTLRANLATLRRALSDRKPDLLLLVDYPHFNMKLAATAKALSIPVLYFIAPKVWASRPGRVHELGNLVDHMAVILPFEAPLFENAGIATTYVGNPLLDNKALVSAARLEKPAATTSRVALLPGSRKSEINYLLPVMLSAAAMLKDKHPAATFLLPIAHTIDRNLVEGYITQSKLDVELANTCDYDLLARCDVAMVASGTATLELAILGVPMVVAYRMNPLSYAVVKRWLIIENVSLANIVADTTVVPELLQDDATAENLFTQVDALLTNENVRTRQKADLTSIYNKLGTGGAAKRLASVITSLVPAHKNNAANTVDAACP